MKLDVEYRQEEIDDYAKIKVIKKEFCCEELKKAWGNNFIGLADYENKELVRNKETVSINIYKCSQYPEGAVWDDTRIQFCPFCGKEIEVNVKTISKEQLKKEKYEEQQIRVKEIEDEMKRQQERLDEIKNNLRKEREKIL